jgi:hypothetical protein
MQTRIAPMVDGEVLSRLRAQLPASSRVLPSYVTQKALQMLRAMSSAEQERIAGNFGHPLPDDWQRCDAEEMVSWTRELAAMLAGAYRLHYSRSAS